jgi:hypothetical protein
MEWAYIELIEVHLRHVADMIAENVPIDAIAKWFP